MKEFKPLPEKYAELYQEAKLSPTRIFAKNQYNSTESKLKKPTLVVIQSSESDNKIKQ